MVKSYAPLHLLPKLRGSIKHWLVDLSRNLRKSRKFERLTAC